MADKVDFQFLLWFDLASDQMLKRLLYRIVCAVSGARVDCGSNPSFARDDAPPSTTSSSPTR